MALSRRTSRSRFTLLLLVLTSITVITLDFRGQGTGVIGDVRDVAVDALAPVRSGAAAVLDPVGDAASGVVGYGELEDENARLRSRIAELEGDALQEESAAEQLQELLALNELDYVGTTPAVAARVVSAPVSNFEQTIELDRGSDDGVGEGMPVVSGRGLVGRVVGASASRSVVQLITDPGSAVGVRLLRSGDVGVAEGQGASRDLTVSYVEVGTDVRLGERVFTSGIDDSVFPPDIPVGRVTERGSQEGDLEQQVRVEPVADLVRLRYVKVLQWKAGES